MVRVTPAHSLQFVEEQAIDRVHRLNQTADVIVYKLTVRDTVEERILELQEKKRRLADETIEGKAGAAKLTMEDMLRLFRRDDADVGQGAGGGGEGGSEEEVANGVGNANGNGVSRQREREREKKKNEHEIYGRRW